MECSLPTLSGLSRIARKQCSQSLSQHTPFGNSAVAVRGITERFLRARVYLLKKDLHTESREPSRSCVCRRTIIYIRSSSSHRLPLCYRAIPSLRIEASLCSAIVPDRQKGGCALIEERAETKTLTCTISNRYSRGREGQRDTAIELKSAYQSESFKGPKAMHFVLLRYSMVSKGCGCSKITEGYGH